MCQNRRGTDPVDGGSKLGVIRDDRLNGFKETA